jgi:hypothetical protein
VSAEGPRFRRHGSVSRYWARLRTHLSQLGWPQRWRGCFRRRRAHRPVGRPGRCFGPSIRPCRWRWYPTACAQGWCSRRNRSGDKSRHRRARTTPVGGSPVGQFVGEPVSRDGAASRRAGKTRRAERSVACRRPTDPRPAQTGWLLVALRFKARRDDRIFKPGRRALLRNADRPRLAEQNELFYSAVSITFDREEITRNKSVSSLRTAFTEHVRRARRPGSEQARDTWDLAVIGHRGNLSFTGIRQPWLAQSVKRSAAEQLPRLPRCQSQSPGRRRPGLHAKTYRVVIPNKLKQPCLRRDTRLRRPTAAPPCRY